MPPVAPASIPDPGCSVIALLLSSRAGSAAGRWRARLVPSLRHILLWGRHAGATTGPGAPRVCPCRHGTSRRGSVSGRDSPTMTVGAHVPYPKARPAWRGQAARARRARWAPVAVSSDNPRGARQEVPVILDSVLRAGEGKILRKLKRIAEQVNSIEDDFVAMSDAELRGMTDELKQRYADGESLDDLLPEAFAARPRGREAHARPASLRRPAHGRRGDAHGQHRRDADR